MQKLNEIQLSAPLEWREVPASNKEQTAQVDMENKNLEQTQDNLISES
jgi:hypothetical protein